TLTAGDDEQLAMPKAVQRHPVRGDYLHIDFARIDTDIDVHVEIPVHTENEEKVRPGVVTVTLPQLPIVCKPLKVPDSITIDVSELGIGDSVHAGELELPEGVLLDVDEDRTVLTITVPAEVEEEEVEPEIDLAALEGLSEEELEQLEEVAEAAAQAEGGEAGEGGAG
ncbi:MAG TPA: 50S ribosomal protein L25, partial [Nitriliruptorales bacterium]